MGVPLHAVGFSSQFRDVNGRTSLFEISDQDVAGDPSYYGYLNSRGQYIIMQQNLGSGTFRYFAGLGKTTTYSTAWTGRATLAYVTYDKISFVTNP